MSILIITMTIIKTLKQQKLFHNKPRPQGMQTGVIGSRDLLTSDKPLKPHYIFNNMK